MTNDPQIDRALGAVNGGGKGINFPRIIQNTVGALVVASILGLARCAIDIGERFDALKHSYSIHVNDGLRKHALLERDMKSLSEMLYTYDEDLAGLLDFKTAGERFTRQDGERLELRMRHIETGQQLTQVALAKLPQTLHFPFTESWQDRILRNERAVAECAAKLEVAKDLYSNVERSFMKHEGEHEKGDLGHLGIERREVIGGESR